MCYRQIAAAFFTLLILNHPAVARQPILLRAHAHNDYKHRRPLTDALENGFFSIEADVFYENGLFVVAHTKAGIRKKNTLEKLYLQQLADRITANNGRVYADGPLEFELMIDLKGSWNIAQLDSLSRLIARYEKSVTVFRDGVKTAGAVKIVLSGSGAKYMAAEFNPRYFSVDGSFSDFHSKLDSNIICRTSASFRSFTTWRGIGKMNEFDQKKLRELVSGAHMSGRKIRFWAATNKRKVWKELLDAGVDWISVDKLKKFRKFYLEYSGDSLREQRDPSYH